MRYLKFKVVSDDEMGEAGILCNIHRNWENYSPALGVNGLAHDILEHGSRETGTFHEEAAAHGGYFFIRLLSGHTSNYYPKEKNAVSGLARSWQDSPYGVAEPPKVVTLDKYEHEMLDEFFAEMRPEAITEWEQENDFEWADDGAISCPYTTDENWPKLCGWFKYGYARAKRRFNGDASQAYRTYKAIGETIDREWPSLQDYTDSGTEFTLVLDYGAATARIRYPWDF